jgi:dolichyl-phosphate beta-glucosyltransferase
MGPVLPGSRLTAPSVSIVAPAFNEERRLGRFLELMAAAEATLGEMGLALCEVIVVDDGSTDATPDILSAAAARDGVFVPLLGEGPNRGKGAAIRSGAAVARGDLVLLVDVDMSTPLGELAKLWERMRAGADVVIGSRDVTGAVIVRAPEHRKRIGRTFNALVRRTTGLSFKDTQCGFKLMRSDTARELLGQQRVAGYAYDVELLVLARRLGLHVEEVPVVYVHDSDSKVNPLRASPQMALDVVRIAYRARPKIRPAPRARPTHPSEESVPGESGPPPA